MGLIPGEHYFMLLLPCFIRGSQAECNHKIEAQFEKMSVRALNITGEVCLIVIKRQKREACIGQWPWLTRVESCSLTRATNNGSKEPNY